MHPTLASVSWTPVDLANHLWQSSLIALALLALMALCARLSARTRLTLGWMALAKFALPFGFFAAFVSLFGGNPESWRVERLFSKSDVPAAIAAAVPVTEDSAVGVPLAAPAGVDAPALPVVSLSPVRILGAVWLAGFAGLYGWWILGGVRLRRHLLAEATEVSPAMAAHLAAAADKASVHVLPRCCAVRDGNGPGLLGIFSPILALPHGLEEKLTPAELESVLLHELVHLQRRDPFWLAMHVTAVSALWFNPIAWLLSRWIRLETEKACDERVLELTGRPDIYAQGILKVVHLALGLPEPTLLSVITPPVVSRVKNILRHESRPDRRWPRLAALTTGAILLALGGSAGSLAKTIDLSVAPADSKAPAVTGQPFTKGAGNYRFTPSGPTAGPRVTLELNFPSAAPTETVPTGEVDRPESPVPTGTNATSETPKFGPRFIPTQGTQNTRAWEAALTPATATPTAAVGIPPATISIDFPDEEIRGVVRNVAALFKLNVVIPDELAGRTSIKLRDVTWKQIFQSVLAPAGYTFVEEPNAVRIVKADPVPTYKFNPATGSFEVSGFEVKPAASTGRATESRLSLDFPDQEIRLILRNVADLFELNIIIPDTLQGKTSVKLQDVTWREVFKSALDPVGYTFVEEGNIVRIVRKPAAVERSSAIAPPATVLAAAETLPLRIEDLDAAIRDSRLARVYELKDLDVIPTPTLQVPAAYPAEQKRSGTEGWVDMAFVVDANGLVQNVRPISSSAREFEPAAIQAVSKWKFQPGRKSGNAVPANMSVVINFHLTPAQKTSAANQPTTTFAAANASTTPSPATAPTPPVTGTTESAGGPVFELKDLDTIPKATLQVGAVYPAALKGRGTEGFVEVAFIVDRTGLVQNVRAISSSDREFESAALQAVAKWKFQPGRKAGKPAAANMNVRINFHLPAGNQKSSGAKASTPAPATTDAATPPVIVTGFGRIYELRDLDVIPAATKQVGAVYPADLKRLAVEGSVQVAFVVDEKGDVRDVRALDSTDDRFEAAARKAVSQWKFKPGKKAGVAVATNLDVTLNFHLTGNNR